MLGHTGLHRNGGPSGVTELNPNFVQKYSC